MSRSEYLRNYRKTHPEFVKRQNERNKLYRASHKEQYNALAAKYRARDRDKINERQNKVRKQLKLQALNYYSFGKMCCACCGESTLQFLTIDHIDGGGTKGREYTGGGSGLHHWLKRNNYPIGLQVLCFNCNCGRAVNGGQCPHKMEVGLKIEP